MDEGNRMFHVETNKKISKWYSITLLNLAKVSARIMLRYMRGVGESLGPGSARFWNEKGGSDCSSCYPIRITEMIQKGYSRYNSPKIKEAIQKEIKRIWDGTLLNSA